MSDPEKRGPLFCENESWTKTQDFFLHTRLVQEFSKNKFSSGTKKWKKVKIGRFILCFKRDKRSYRDRHKYDPKRVKKAFRWET